jgi:capsule polysaccharide export protein KpsE/RkpR
MSKAMEQIVDAYVRLNNRRGLEDLRMHRLKLAVVDLKERTGYDFSLPIGQIDQEIAVIEAGLEKLAAANKTATN